MPDNTDQQLTDFKAQLEKQSQRIDDLEGKGVLLKEFFFSVMAILLIFFAISCWYLVESVLNTKLNTQQAAVLITVISGWCVLVIAAMYYLDRNNNSNY